MLDRIAQIVLVIFGALLLVMFVLGMAVSCRSTSAADPAGATATAQSEFATPDSFATFIAPPPTPIINLPPPASPTPTPLPGPEAMTATAQAINGINPGGGGEAQATVAPGAGGSSGGGLAPGSTINHVISRGEWMLQIARCYGITFQSLQSVNRVPNPDYILPGGVLVVSNIGSVGPVVGPPCVVAYTVTATDSWDSLAQRFGTSAAILRRANPGALTVGRVIWVPRLP